MGSCANSAVAPCQTACPLASEFCLLKTTSCQCVEIATDCNAAKFCSSPCDSVSEGCQKWRFN